MYTIFKNSLNVNIIYNYCKYVVPTLVNSSYLKSTSVDHFENYIILKMST